MTQDDLAKKPLRTCRSMHACCRCSSTIKLGDAYYDGGYGRRAHKTCVVSSLPAEEPVEVEFMTLVLAPKTCRRCSACDGEHHFSDAITVFVEDASADHPAAKIGIQCWYTCKHCEAWTVNPEMETPIFSGPEEGH